MTSKAKTNVKVDKGIITLLTDEPDVLQAFM
jgi:hypothetical protein